MEELKETTPEERKQVVEEKSISFAAKGEIVFRKTVKIVTKNTIRGMSTVFSNIDFGAEISAYTFFYLAGKYAQNGDSPISSIFAVLGVIFYIFKLRLPQGKLNEFLKLPPDEMKASANRIKSGLTQMYPIDKDRRK
jgi:hypothetical protein